MIDSLPIERERKDRSTRFKANYVEGSSDVEVGESDVDASTRGAHSNRSTSKSSRSKHKKRKKRGKKKRNVVDLRNEEDMDQYENKSSKKLKRAKGTIPDQTSRYPRRQSRESSTPHSSFIANDLESLRTGVENDTSMAMGLARPKRLQAPKRSDAQRLDRQTPKRTSSEGLQRDAIVSKVRSAGGRNSKSRKGVEDDGVARGGNSTSERRTTNYENSAPEDLGNSSGEDLFSSKQSRLLRRVSNSENYATSRIEMVHNLAGGKRVTRRQARVSNTTNRVGSSDDEQVPGQSDQNEEADEYADEDQEEADDDDDEEEADDDDDEEEADDDDDDEEEADDDDKEVDEVGDSEAEATDDDEEEGANEADSEEADEDSSEGEELSRRRTVARRQSRRKTRSEAKREHNRTLYESYVGRRVCRDFTDAGVGMVYGSVKSYKPPEFANDVPLWVVQHDDLDVEDLELDELQDALERAEADVGYTLRDRSKWTPGTYSLSALLNPKPSNSTNSNGKIRTTSHVRSSSVGSASGRTTNKRSASNRASKVTFQVEPTASQRRIHKLLKHASQSVSSASESSASDSDGDTRLGESDSNDSSDSEAADLGEEKQIDSESVIDPPTRQTRHSGSGKKDVGLLVHGSRKKKGKSSTTLADTTPLKTKVDFTAVGGLDHHISALKEMVMLPLLYPEAFQRFGITPPRGVLFYGPPGTGKTLVARAMASSCVTQDGKPVTFFMRKGADCLSKWVGEAERQLRLLFDEARKKQPSIIFFDEIDGLAPVRSAKQEQIHSSIVSTLLALLDGLDDRGQVVVVGATNRIDAIDPALRRPGRFDRELEFSLPDEAARKQILDIHMKNWDPIPSDQFKQSLAIRTKGYCGADLKALCAEASIRALRRRYPQIYKSDQKLRIDLKQVTVLNADFEAALHSIVPASQRSQVVIGKPLESLFKPMLQPAVDNVLREVRGLFPMMSNKQKQLQIEQQSRNSWDPMANTNPIELEKVYGTASTTPGSGATAMYGQFDFLDHCTLNPVVAIVDQGTKGCNLVARAVLACFEQFPVIDLSLPSLIADDTTRSPEEACVKRIAHARSVSPSVVFLPNLHSWWDHASFALQNALLGAIEDGSKGTLLLVTMDLDYRGPSEFHKVYRHLPLLIKLKDTHHLRNWASFARGLHQRIREQLSNFIVQLETTLVCNETSGTDSSGNQRIGIQEELEVVPRTISLDNQDDESAPKPLSRRERKLEKHYLRELRIAMREVLVSMRKIGKYKRFWYKPDEESGFYEVVTKPVTLTTILENVEDHKYLRLKDMKADIKLIGTNLKAFFRYQGTSHEPQSQTIRSHAGDMLDVVDSYFAEFQSRLGYDLVRKCDKVYKRRQELKAHKRPQPKSHSSKGDHNSTTTDASSARAARRFTRSARDAVDHSPPKDIDVIMRELRAAKKLLATKESEASGKTVAPSDAGLQNNKNSKSVPVSVSENEATDVSPRNQENQGSGSNSHDLSSRGATLDANDGDAMTVDIESKQHDDASKDHTCGERSSEVVGDHTTTTDVTSASASRDETAANIDKIRGLCLQYRLKVDEMLENLFMNVSESKSFDKCHFDHILSLQVKLFQLTGKHLQRWKVELSQASASEVGLETWQSGDSLFERVTDLTVAMQSLINSSKGT